MTSAGTAATTAARAASARRACTADPALAPADDGGPVERIDLAGFSSAIESYEYSKQPMNGIAFESGAGTSLLFGPVLNPTGATGAAALQLAQTWFLHMAGAQQRDEPLRDAPTSRRPNRPRLARPLADAAAVLVLESGHRSRRTTPAARSAPTTTRGSRARSVSDNYECDYTTLHLPDRRRRGVR